MTKYDYNNLVNKIRLFEMFTEEAESLDRLINDLTNGIKFDDESYFKIISYNTEIACFPREDQLNEFVNWIRVYRRKLLEKIDNL